MVDTDPEPGDLSFKPVATCETVLQSLTSNEASPAYNPEFATLIKNISAVTPQEINSLFTTKVASITVMVPPRATANGLLASLEKGDVAEPQVRSCLRSALIYCCALKLCLQGQADSY